VASFLVTLSLTESCFAELPFFKFKLKFWKDAHFLHRFLGLQGLMFVDSPPPNAVGLNGTIPSGISALSKLM
jgi:hypothetical protein